MRDEERIEMYYKFGLLDWKNEQQIEKIKNGNSNKENSISMWENLVRFLRRIIKRYRTLKI